MTEEQRLHFRAVRMLAFTTIFWSVSFPLVKAIGILQTRLIPESTSWFHAGLTGFTRFGMAALILLVMAPRIVTNLTRLEIWQGMGLGFFAGSGILLQMDGLGHTSASTSAFVTQAYTILVPILVAIRDRVGPGSRLIFAILMMLGGIGILSGFNFRTFHLGRGETETLGSAFFFAAQILWLERAKFARNDPIRFSFVMFLSMSLMSAPIVMATWQSPTDVLTCYADAGVMGLNLALVLFPTVGAFVAMNKWQRFVPATEAAIIYGTEPVWTSLLTLFLPAWLSAWTNIQYPNETVTTNLVVGGSLVIGANLLLQWKWARRKQA